MIVLEKIDEIQKYILTLRLTNGKPIYKTQSQTGFISFYIGLEIVKDIYKEFIETKKLNHYESYSACQDHLEVFFSAIRSRNGWCTNPSILQFKSALKSLIVHAEIKYSQNGNCTDVETLPILQNINKVQRTRLDRVSIFKSRQKIVLDDESEGIK